MAQSTQAQIPESSMAVGRSTPLREVPLAFELYGDSTVRAGADGLGVRLRLGPYQLLFDCGAATAQALLGAEHLGPEQQGDRGSDELGLNTEFQVDNRLESGGLGRVASETTPKIDFVFCSHAHGDHAEGLLAMHRTWPRLPILASQATNRLLSLLWPEQNSPEFCQELSWGAPTALKDDLSVTLFPAGHLPGAAVVVVTYSPAPNLGELPAKPIKVAYVGDGALSPARCTPGLDLDSLRGLKPELLIAEGTYGTDRYPRRRQQENEFVEQLLAAFNQGRSVLMPAPSLGVAQEVIVLLRSHHLCTGQAFDIWVDEPIAQGCDRYFDLLDEMPVATQNFAHNQSLFWDERIRPYVHRLAAPPLKEPTAEDRFGRPGFFLIHFESSWGQCVSSRDTAWELWLDRTDKLFSGASGWATHRAFQYQSPESLQRLATRLQTGDLHLNSYQLTDHCDGLGTTQLIHNLRPQHLLLVHGGSSDALQQLGRLEELRNRYQVHVAEPGIEQPIAIVESLSPNDLPQPRYDGELRDEKNGIVMQLAQEIAQDPRWQALAETGLLEVEWQGDGLLIRGVSPQQLSGGGRDSIHRYRRPKDCCKICHFYRSQYCRNPESPLEDVKVLAQGYCQEFQPAAIDP